MFRLKKGAIYKQLVGAVRAHKRRFEGEKGGKARDRWENRRDILKNQLLEKPWAL